MEVSYTKYFAGTSGLLLPVANKLHYPEQFKNGSRLSYYSSLMNTIEINSSFYKMPKEATIRRWKGDVSNEFRFTFKLCKQITHNRHLAFDPELVASFFQVVANVQEKKGCILVQLPPSVRITHFKQLRLLMSVLRGNDPQGDWKIAFEFRNASLYASEVYELLEEFGFALVIHDKIPHGRSLLRRYPEFVYLRFHGPDGNYRGSYSEQVLAEYAGYVADWLNQGKQVFVYFNNTIGDVHGNFHMFRNFVADKAAEIVERVSDSVE